MYLRVPKNVWLMKKNGTSLVDRVKDYKYMYNDGDPFVVDITAAIAIYDPANQDEEDSGESSKYWQMTLCSKEDVVYK